MVGKTLNQRYRLEQPLASGPRGELYVATDAVSGEMLTVQLFAADVDLRGEDGLCYLATLRALEGLHHPHLLLPLRTAHGNGHPYQVLPYFPGLPLLRSLQEAPLAVGEAVEVLRQVASALGRLHAAGVLHLNLKASNVLLSREDGEVQAVLTDPARHLLDGAQGLQARADGAAFQAPELAPWLETTPDERADLYSLGVLGYFLLTGALPYPPASPHQMLRQHLVSPVPDPRARNARVPPRLAATVMKLMAKRPRERYAATAGLLEDLAHWGGEARDDLGRSDRPAAFPADAGLVGRDSAEEAVLAALARARGGHGTWIVLEGAEGSGRRSVMLGTLGPVEAAQGLALFAQAPPAGWAPPFHLPLALLDSLLMRWPSLPDLQRRDLLQRLHQTLGENAGVLTEMVPALSALLPQAGTPVPLPAERERSRTLHVLTELFVALAEPKRPLVLYLEALETADADSLAWLQHLHRRLHDAAILALCSMTQGRVPAGGALADWLAGQGATRDAPLRLELPALTAEQTATQVDRLLGGQAVALDPAVGDRLPAQLAEWLRARWRGNPMAQEFALRRLLARHVLTCDGPWPGGGFAWSIDQAALEAEALPEDLAGLLRLWLGELEAGLLLLLEAAAVFAGPVSFEPLCALLDNLPAELVAGRLNAALRAGVLARGPGGYRFRHRLMRALVAQATPEERRTEHHRVLAAHLEAEAESLPLQRQHLIALHFKAAGDVARFVEHGLHAMHAAVQHQALEGACAWGEPLLPRIARDVRRPGMLLALGRCQALLHRHVQALETLRTFRDGPGTDSEHVEALAWTARCEAERGDTSAAMQAVRDALNIAGATLPASSVGTTLARWMTGVGIRYEALRASADAASPAAATSHELRLAGLYELAAQLLAAEDPPLAGLADEKVLRLLSGRQPTPLLLRALIRLGELEGHREAASLRAAGELLRRNAFAFERALLLAAQGRCALNHLELHAAGETLREALRGFAGLGDLLGQATVLASQFELARLQGPLEGLRRIAAEHALAAAAIGRPQPLTWSGALGAFAEGMAGRLAPDEAVRRLVQAASQLDARTQAAGVATLHLLAAELLLSIGREGEALDLLQRVRERRDVPPTLEARLDAALAEGLLLRAAERIEQRNDYLRQADVLLRRLDASAGWLPRLRLELPRLEAMSRILHDRADAALPMAEEASERLEAQGARIPQGLLCLRVGQALKATGADTWLHWCGRALSHFETVGATLLQGNLRRVVDMDPLLVGVESTAPAVPAGGLSSPQGTGHGALLGLIERLGALQPAEQGLWERDLLRALLEAADADRGALFLPNGDGALLLAAQLPGQGTATGVSATPVNRWLVDAVWQEGAGQLLDPYQPPAGRDSLGFPETRSVLCIPLHSGARRHGVAYLEAERRRLIYEPGDVARLEALGRQAGLALSLREHLGRIGIERERMAEQGRRQQDLQVWATHAATLDDAGTLLHALLKAPGLPPTLTVAALFWRDGQTLQPAACAVRGGTAPQAEDLPRPPLALRTSCAAMAAAGMQPVHLRAASGQAPAAEELALLERLAADDGLWLPLLWDGVVQGVLLLAAETRLTPTEA
ncbi:MAG: AAA family ATPase, partial [Candidatus Lambdaproteobacteria bacterium]|nr:AAA family ATPase [Candidatus Lambdaproteobacteria bacterium]